MPTDPAVSNGDSVMVATVNGVPTVIGVKGSGDRQRAAAEQAQTVASQASEAVTQVQSDIADFKSGADVDYAIYSYVDDEVGELSTTVSATYLSKSDAQTTYATQSQLTQTAEGITASVSQDYVSKADAQTTYATKSELTVGLEGITAEVSQTYATKTEAATTGVGSGESVEVADGSKLRSLTVYGKSVQDGTPTPDAPVEIQTVSGANLLPKMTAGTYGTNGITIEVDSNGVATLSGTTTANGNAAIIPLEQPITITQQMVDNGFYVHYNNSESNAKAAPNFESSTAVSAFAYTMAPANRIVRLSSSHVGKTIDRVRFWLSRGVTLSGTFAPALIADSSTVPYIPYGSIGIAVRDSGDALISLTHIPLDGNVLASLPDGTCDVLTVDESGNVTLTKRVGAESFGSVGSYSGGAVGTGGWGGSTTKGFYRYQPAIAQGNASSPVGLSDSFSKLGSIYGNESVGFMIANTPANANQRYIGFRLPVSLLADYGYDDSSAASNVAALRAWLADGNDFRVLYQLAGPSTVGLGRISMPALSDACTVGVIASLTPAIDAGWWTENGSAIASNVDSISALDAKSEAAITSVSESFNETITAQGLEMSSRLQVMQAQLDGHEEVVQDVTKSFRFSQNGLEIGASNSQMRAILDNDALRFQSGGADVLVLDATSSTAKAERMSVGKYQWRSLDNGDSMALVYTG